MTKPKCKDCRWNDDTVCRHDAPKLVSFIVSGKENSIYRSDFTAVWPEVDPENDWCRHFNGGHII